MQCFPGPCAGDEEQAPLTQQIGLVLQPVRRGRGDLTGERECAVRNPEYTDATKLQPLHRVHRREAHPCRSRPRSLLDPDHGNAPSREPVVHLVQEQVEAGAHPDLLGAHALADPLLDPLDDRVHFDLLGSMTSGVRASSVEQ